jgi:thiamine kinase-like enzyme
MTLTQSEIYTIASQFSNESLSSFEPLFGGANNKLWQVSYSSNKRIVIKEYGEDGAKRLRREWAYLETLERYKVSGVPEPIWFDKERSVGVYTFLDGKKLESSELSEEHIREAAYHLREVFSIPAVPGYQAEGAHFTLCGHLNEIESRIRVLESNLPKTVEEMTCRYFVSTKVRPEWNRRVKHILNRELDIAFGNINKFFSPSDFGFHNILYNGKTLGFVDFEYSGLDDAAKLLADFSLAPQVAISSGQNMLFRDLVKSNLNLDRNFDCRLALFDYIFPIKWICIVLNIFNFSKSQRILKAKNLADAKNLKSEKLNLAVSLFNKLDRESLV